jgi:anti-anti-sigma factor
VTVAQPTFRIENFQGETGTTIKLAGELDSAASAQLLAGFEAWAGARDPGQLTLDLAEVSFIDSAGMRAIIMIERGATERGLALTMAPPPADVTELLQTAGIADRLASSRGADAPAPDPPFTERVELELPRDPFAPGRARAELRGALREHTSESDRATLTLLTSELVTNAVVHPDPEHGAIELRIVTYPDRVRVEVSDAGTGFDLERLPVRPRETGGHGLIVVDGLSSRWGTNRRAVAEGGGFCVWFELDLEHQPEAAAGSG